MKPEQLRCKYTCLAQRLVLAHPPLVWKQKKKKKTYWQKVPLHTEETDLCGGLATLLIQNQTDVQNNSNNNTINVFPPNEIFVLAFVASC